MNRQVTNSYSRRERGVLRGTGDPRRNVQGLRVSQIMLNEY